MQVILGATGQVGRALARILPPGEGDLRLVSRNPPPAPDRGLHMPADLRDAGASVAVLAGASVAYLVAGLPYDSRVWAADWPRIMDNVIEGCIRHSVRLVFLDNVYAYGRVPGPMTEETPFNPCSRKGEVRARIATTLLQAMARQQVTAAIVRAADFYGADRRGPISGVADQLVIAPLAEGRTPTWLGDAQRLHSFSYVPDIARSLALVGATPEAFGQSWHALTDRQAPTGAEFIRLACEIAGRRHRFRSAPRWMLRAAGLFRPAMRETVEMLYQFEEDYVFSSAKLEGRFAVAATPLRDALATLLSPA